MKNKYFVILLFAAVLAAPAFARQKVDWQAIKQLPPGTHIYVQISGGWECSLQKVTDDQLFCTMEYPGSTYKGPHDRADHVFNRADIRYQCNNETGCSDHFLCVGEMDTCTAFDYSSGTLSLFAAAEGGSGWRSGSQPNSFAGVKLGIAGLSMDLQYDRLSAQNGFSVEGSGVIPVFRVPRWRAKNDHLFLRLYAEPGLGYRAGSGPFGQYASGKALLLFGDKWLNDHASPFIEVQRRFPFNSPLSGDNRIAFGFMVAVCEHCGLD
jgi:hypothetical protein